MGRIEEASAAEDVLALPFDQYQRYKLIAEVVARLCPDPAPTILDVGGWPGTLRRFLPAARIVVADLHGTMPLFVRASGTALPFRDRAFDCVVSSDTLEHVPPEGREAFLAELARVARGPIVLGAPFDSPEVRAAEAVLRELIRAKYPESYGFIEEHEEHGLPDLAATRGALEAAGRATIALPNGYLPHWLAMIALYFALQWRSPYEPLFAGLNAYYNRTYYRADNRAPSYRATVVAVPGGGEGLAALERELLAPDAAGPPAHDWPQIATLLRAIELEAIVAPGEPMRRIVELERLVEERTAWAQGAVRGIEERDAIIRRQQAQIAGYAAQREEDAAQFSEYAVQLRRAQAAIEERDAQLRGWPGKVLPGWLILRRRRRAR